MAKIEVKISYVAEWSDKSARVLVLQTKSKKISFPIIIAENEAFNLVKELENLTLKRPQTHDLLFSILNSFNIKMKYAHIYNLVEGIFYTRIHCADDKQEINVEARISDAAILALKYNSPLFIEDFILEQVGLFTEGDEEGGSAEKKNNLTLKTIQELEVLLKETIEEENYEYASIVRDEINKKTTK